MFGLRRLWWAGLDQDARADFMSQSGPGSVKSLSERGTVAQSVVLSPHSKKVLGSIPAGDAVGAGGVFSPPRHQCPYPGWG